LYFHNYKHGYGVPSTNSNSFRFTGNDMRRIDIHAYGFGREHLYMGACNGTERNNRSKRYVIDNCNYYLHRYRYKC
jgi:hypothetical protein